MQKPLPAQPSLEQFKKQAKELVKNHRNRDAATFGLIREFLPSLTQKTDEEISLYPFALHDAQSVIARQHGFPSWTQLRNQVEKNPGVLRPEASVEEKFKTICRSRKENDFALYCSVMDESMRAAVSPENFEKSSLNPYFNGDWVSTYMGEMAQGSHAIHFWRVSAPGQKTDLLVRMGIKDDLVSGLLFSGPFDTAMNRKK